MTANEVLPLEEIKDYLRVDFPDDDLEIQRMVKSAISFVETYTNIHLVKKTKQYPLSPNESFQKIFDYPFKYYGNLHELKYSNFSKFHGDVELILGFDTREEIPENLIMVIKRIVEFYYYQSEKEVEKEKFFQGIRTELDTERRFIM